MSFFSDTIALIRNVDIKIFEESLNSTYFLVRYEVDQFYLYFTTKNLLNSVQTYLDFCTNL